MFIRSKFLQIRRDVFAELIYLLRVLYFELLTKPVAPPCV